ncbi:hypothetical protein BpHYR1_018638 [Brachionus plicatilis]|uniref:Uncharacterized protein n=1 Tax=Brachionus plicatilis TaxID=10195 RepID=A0A3M7PV52_BRAPC|nr:hypothetical protein BpHYR1_018638 [Brachionus plicatilis]
MNDIFPKKNDILKNLCKNKMQKFGMVFVLVFVKKKQYFLNCVVTNEKRLNSLYQINLEFHKTPNANFYMRFREEKEEINSTLQGFFLSVIIQKLTLVAIYGIKI